MASYTFRRSVLTVPETWTVTPMGLDYTNNGVDHFTCPFQNIVSIRLKYAPTRMKTNNYNCELELNPSTKIKIPSISYASFANFEDKAVDYRAFVQDLSEAVVKVNPTCIFYSGRKMSSLIIENGLILLMLIFLFWIFTALSAAFSGFIVIKIIIILYSLYFVIKAIGINKPGFFNPNQIPEKILPASNN
jgi:hypothetical protein